MLKRPAFLILFATLAVAMALPTTPRTASAEEGDRCGGHVEPRCRTVETCAQIPQTDVLTCTTNYYYFPDAQ